MSSIFSGFARELGKRHIDGSTIRHMFLSFWMWAMALLLVSLWHFCSQMSKSWKESSAFSWYLLNLPSIIPQYLFLSLLSILAFTNSDRLLFVGEIDMCPVRWKVLICLDSVVAEADVEVFRDGVHVEIGVVDSGTQIWLGSITVTDALSLFGSTSLECATIKLRCSLYSTECLTSLCFLIRWLSRRSCTVLQMVQIIGLFTPNLSTLV